MSPSPASRVVILLLGASSIVRAAIDPDLQFSFDDRSERPAINRIEAECTVFPMGKKELTFADGRQGPALVIGRDYASIEVKAEKPFFTSQGTLAFWFQPVDWTAATTNQLSIVRSRNDGDGYLVIQKSEGKWALSRSELFHVCLPHPKLKDNLLLPVIEAGQAPWHHVAVTWREREFTLFVDGRKQSSRSLRTPVTEYGLPNCWYIGPCEKPFRPEMHGSALIDDVVFLGRRVAEDQVPLLMELGRRTAAPAGDNHKPVCSCLKVAKPPVIDGKADDEAWRTAAPIRGFVQNTGDLVKSRQTEVRAVHDTKNLHLLFTSTAPSGHKLRTQIAAGQRDGAAYSDDAIEFYVQDPQTQEVVQLVVNSAGAIYDVRGRNPAWNGRWNLVSRVDQETWICEITIPLSDLGIGPPRNGDSLRVNFCRDWQNPQIWTCWSQSANFSDAGNFGTLVFRDPLPFLQLDALDTFDKKNVAQVKGTVVNPTAADGEVAVQIIADSAAKPILDTTEVVRVEPRARKPFHFERELPEALMNSLTYAVRVGEQVVARQTLPCGTQSIYDLQAAGLADDFSVDVDAWPSEKKLELRCELYPQQEPKEFEEWKLRLTGGAGDVAVLATNVAERSLTWTFDTSSWKTGPYTVHAGLVGKDGRKLEVKRSFDHQPLPNWVGNRIGVDEKAVVPPFTPLRVNGLDVECWGRTYRLGASGLPRSIVSQKKEALAAPVELQVSTGGKSRDIKWSEGVRLVSSNPAHAEFKARGVADRTLPVRVSTRVEYDGMIKLDLELAPQSPATVEQLRLVVPLAEAGCRYLHYVGDNGKSNSDTIELPARSGRLWTVDPKTPYFCANPFVPALWIGNEQGGVGWMTDSDEGWEYRKGEPAIEVVRANGAVTLALNLINRPVELAAPRAFTLALVATPVKPLPKGWRGMTFKAIFPDPECSENMRVLWPLHFKADRAMSFNSGDEAGTRAIVAEEHRQNHPVMPYVDITATGKGLEEYQQFQAEWRTLPLMEITAENAIKEKRFGPKSTPDDYVYVRLSLRGTFRDFLLWGMRSMVKRWDVDGFYLDQTYPLANLNVRTGAAYLRDGKPQPRFDLFTMRDFFKRLATMLHQEGKRPLVWNHMSASIVMPCFSFCNINMDGEQFNGFIQKKQDYKKYLTPAVLRGQTYAKQFGMVPLLISAYTGDLARSEEAARQLLALVLPHEIPVWYGGINPKVLRNVDRAKAEFGIASDEVEFVPYWENRAITATPSCWVSYYRRPGRVLAVVSNLQDQKQSIRLTVQGDTLGLATGWAAVEAVAKAPLTRNGAELETTIPDNDFRLVLLQNP